MEEFVESQKQNFLLVEIFGSDEVNKLEWYMSGQLAFLFIEPTLESSIYQPDT